MDKTLLSKCEMCPHNCKIDRTKIKGRCKVKDKVKVALVSIHKYEEPPISAKNGSGTIFFSGCNLSCVYCQNYKISRQAFGKEITIKRLADIMLEQEKRGAHNINLVTPTMFAMHIKEALIMAKKMGLKIPIVYNTSGYEKVETLKQLEGLIDIYIPDFKYYNNDLAIKYSNAPNYLEYVIKAISEMKRQVKDEFYSDGTMKSGVIIRHLILPNNINDTKAVIRCIKEKFGKNTIVSIMAQYFPSNMASKYDELNRKITKEELEEVENYLFEENMTNGYIQELSDSEEEYVPDFNLDNV